MNQIATIQQGGELALPESRMVEVLRNSLYPGAQDESIFLVLDYCRAAGLDPLQKPVHIVPMWDAKAGRMRDVVMPGVNLYRIQAARSGAFAGMSEPEFGPMVDEVLDGVKIRYPEWCRVTVQRRLSTGEMATFTAVEFWTENYAVKGGKEKSIAPNSMWQKRPRGQLGKCASAQALRIAFPEIASPPTAEEMEGKILDIDQTPTAVEPAKPAEKPPYPDDKFAANHAAWTKLIESGEKPADRVIGMLKSKAKLTDEQVKTLTDIKVKPAATAEDAGDGLTDAERTAREFFGDEGEGA